ncbi:hypothetical protein ACIRH0_06625 [Streptomyces sp. NPDC093675]|uniref:hypothetical protein n=1 Tax=Streptomyces sp. NPDC093675 TaxID=3366049 RepID=UPI0037F89892
MAFPASLPSSRRGIWQSLRRPAAPGSSSSVPGLGGVRFRDLRLTGNTLIAAGAATRRELIHRMGHSSVRATLVYRHLVNGRDHQIADYVDGQIKRVKRPPRGPSGT